MKKLLLLPILVLFIACEQNEPKQVETFAGNYTLSGTVYAVARVDNPQKGSKVDSTTTTFSNKPFNVSLSSQDAKKAIISTTYYTSKSANISMDGKKLNMEKSQYSFIDDGSIISKGSTIYVDEAHNSASFVSEGVLKWTSVVEMVATNPSNGATLILVQTIENKAVKKK